jgi:hypothetical protein
MLAGGGTSKRDRTSAEKRMSMDVKTLNRLPNGKVLKKIPKLKGTPMIIPLKKTFHFGN